MSKKLRRGLAAAAVAGLAIGGTAFAASAMPPKPRPPLPWGAAGYQVQCNKPAVSQEVVARVMYPKCQLVCVQLPCFVSGPLPKPSPVD